MLTVFLIVLVFLTSTIIPSNTLYSSISQPTPEVTKVPWVTIISGISPQFKWSADSRYLVIHDIALGGASLDNLLFNIHTKSFVNIKENKPNHIINQSELSIDEMSQLGVAVGGFKYIQQPDYLISPDNKVLVYIKPGNCIVTVYSRVLNQAQCIAKADFLFYDYIWSLDGSSLLFFSYERPDAGFHYNLQNPLDAKFKYLGDINNDGFGTFYVGGAKVFYVQDRPDTLDFSDDGKTILAKVFVWGQGYKIALINPIMPETSRILDLDSETVDLIYAAAFHPFDSNKLLWVKDALIYEFDLRDSSIITYPISTNGTGVFPVLFSPDGKWLAAQNDATQLLRISDLYPGLPTPTPPPPRQPLTLTTACDHWQGGVAWQVNNPNAGADIPIIWEIPAVTRFGSNVIKRSSQTILNLYYDALGINTASSVKIYVDGVVEAQANAPTCPSRPDTPAIYRPSTATFHFPTLPSVTFGNPNDHPITGDWDGDGVDTLGVFDPLAGRFLLRNSNTPGAPDLSFLYGNPGDIPLAGHWTAASTHDGVGTYRNTNGTMYLFLRNQLTTGYADLTAIVGNPGDLPIVGDWNGDGVDTVGLYRPDSTTFYLFNRNAPDMEVETQFTLSGGVPIAGRWTGSGGAGVGFFADGVFSLKDTLESGAFDRTVNFGETGDVPLAGRWSP
jgi:hypothetical protein